MIDITNNLIQNDLELNTIEAAIADIKAGKVIIVVDDEDRENEGDFICAAECITPEIINFMATHGRGLICAPIDERRADDLGLKLMVSDNTALHETAFTVSIDLIGKGCTTGISAYDRATCIKAMVDPNTTAADFGKPGHIFPLRAKSGGVLRRTGHTEAAIDLAKMAGFGPAGVLVEILNEDGTMARLPQLVGIAKKHDLKIISIKDLVAYRMLTERLIKRETSLKVNTPYGEFDVTAYSQVNTQQVHLAVTKGTWKRDEPVLVRVHSSSEGDYMLGMLFGGYGTKIEKSLELLSKEGKGALVFMQNMSDSSTILSKLEQLKNSNDTSYKSSTFETPNPASMEQRDFGTGAQILRDMGISKIRLVTNNQKRRIGMVGFGLEVVEIVNW
ncbi:MAG: 3,4-dihydroxy-2-butanone-4-phosphate synthase [Bacteroidetes bacterium]|jgi:3,4-dihydroxy 2-butanone 4-phosphate synthase/GTP cyclohydrolase II|nr:3,4-dihydroxy-2-butanone-4-phosphate synthase [Bacteroidota bacterium]MDF1865231.1 3,4-dihydroxy-2-butanone-4-phosphate synthase [Saprospiraceae bacterium]